MPPIKRKNAAPTVTNPIAAWFAGRKQRQQEAEKEKADRVISGNPAENTRTLQHTLEGIDFLHSKLPASALEYKSNPDQKYGDLEQTARALAQLLRKNPLPADVDIRAIDKKLLILAWRYQDAIEVGDEYAARAAKFSLIIGIMCVRNKVPVHRPELLSQFVDLGARYLDEWLTLVEFARLADRMQENINSLTQKYNKTKADYDAEMEALYDRLHSDPEAAAAFHFICSQPSNSSKLSWTERQREVYGMMLEQRFKEVTIDLDRYMLEMENTSLLQRRNEVDLLSVKLARVPVTVDPDQMNRYQEALEGLFRELAEKDAELADALDLLTDIEGQIEQLDIARRGKLSKMSTTAAQVYRILEVIRRKESEAISARERDRLIRLQALGLHSNEELEELLRQLEAELMELLRSELANAQAQMDDTEEYLEEYLGIIPSDKAE